MEKGWVKGEKMHALSAPPHSWDLPRPQERLGARAAGNGAGGDGWTVR